MHHDLELLRHLLDSGERTSLAVAVSRGDVEMARSLLAAGADPNAADESRAGNSPLADAVERGDLEMVRLLTSSGGNPFVEGWMRLTPCDRARIRFATNASALNAELLQALHSVDHGWDVPHREIRDCDDIPTLRTRISRVLSA